MISYPSYRLIIERRAQKFLEKLDTLEHKKVVFKIKDLVAPTQQSLDIKKLQGYKNVYRLRIDGYRVVFSVIQDKKILIILVIGHRKEIYDKLQRISF
ncbi:type II toxin-antitoxin system RelE/ParE family toxin [bacterium]|jgi:mRNA interferase RelE/StbE|nr:type II toxin-antitoxin system RelE/ParE family toxin [bacterium]MBT5014814.1 type II toxin-antitoxin system RelE/ParE family toxin [bacterium]